MNTNILDLNISILELIFARLDKFEDKKNLARAHPKLFRAFAYQNREQVKSEISFYRDDKYSRHWVFMLEWWGPSLTSIFNCPTSVVDSGDLVELAAKFCPNLEKIMFVMNEDNIIQLQYNLPKLRMLKSVEIIKNCMTWECTNNYLIGSLQSLKYLRILRISGYLNIIERAQLNNLIQLKELNICSIEANYFNNIQNLLGHLCVLHLNTANTTTLTQLAIYCTNLEKLKLLVYNNHSNFPYFPKLTYLGIMNVMYLNDFLGTLDSRYNETLQVLNINLLPVNEQTIEHLVQFRALKRLVSGDIQPSLITEIVKLPLERIRVNAITQIELFRLVIECPTLNVLDCIKPEIDEKFLPTLLDILAARGFQPDRPFRLDVTTEKIHKTKLLTQLAYAANSNILKIHYKFVD